MPKKANKTKKKINLKNFRIPKWFWTVLKIVFALFLILFFVFAAAEKLNISAITDFNDNFRNRLASLTPGKGYPYQINSGAVENITILNGNIFVLMDDQTLSLDSTAKEVKTSQHTYSNPAMNTKSSKAVVYNRNGNRYRVENRTDVLYSGETAEDEKIITAALSKKGHLALATFSDSCSSKLMVYSSNYKKEIFEWQCSQDSITSVDLSDNGKYAAVSVVGARDGEIYSKVYVFDFDYSDPKMEFEYYGTAMLAVRFVKGDNVVAVGDNLVSYLKSSKTKEDIEYGTSSLAAFDFSEDGETAIVLSKYGSTNSQVLYCYSSSFNKSCEKELDKAVKSIYMENGRISLLFEDQIVVYRSNGGIYHKYDTDNTAKAVFNLGNKTYVYSNGKIARCK